MSQRISTQIFFTALLAIKYSTASAHDSPIPHAHPHNEAVVTGINAWAVGIALMAFGLIALAYKVRRAQADSAKGVVLSHIHHDIVCRQTAARTR